MASPELWKILIACVGFGAGGEALRQYRGFKARRRATPREVRNAGFWTDKRLYQAEALFAAAALAVPFTAITMAVNTNESPAASYVALLAYPFAIYLLMRGMNMDEPQ